MKLDPIFRQKTRTQCGDVFPFLDAAPRATRLRVLRCLFANQPGGRCTANAACEPWPKVNESFFFSECVTGFPFPKTLFGSPPPPTSHMGGFLGVSLSFSAYKSSPFFRCAYYSLGHFMSKMDHWPTRAQNPGAAWLSLAASVFASTTLFKLEPWLLVESCARFCQPENLRKKMCFFSLRLLRLLGQREIF